MSSEKNQKLRDLTEAEELTELIKRALKNRKATIATQKSLEGAWRKAVPKNSLNHKVSFEKESASPALKEAIKKERKIKELQQKTFLVFQTITEEKHEEQVHLAEMIVKMLKRSPNNQIHYSEVSEKVEGFLKEEDRINKIFIKNVRSSYKAVEDIKKELLLAKKLPCRDKRVEKLLCNKLEILAEFLTWTENILRVTKKEI